MRLLLNHQFILFSIQSKSISIEQGFYERSQTIVVTSLRYLIFLMSKTKT